MKEKYNRDLLSLSQMYPLVLGNLGAGNSTMKAVLMVFSPASCWIKVLFSNKSRIVPSEPFIRAIQGANFPFVAIASSRGH